MLSSEKTKVSSGFTEHFNVDQSIFSTQVVNLRFKKNIAKKLMRVTIGYKYEASTENDLLNLHHKRNF